jgi:hypothetical protein
MMPPKTGAFSFSVKTCGASRLTQEFIELV